MLEVWHIKSKSFLKCIIFTVLLSCSDVANSTNNEPSFANWSLSGRVVNQVRIPITEAKLTLQTKAGKYLSSTDDKGFFSFEFKEQESPLELSLSSEKSGWATTKIQQYWLEGRQSLTLLQERVVQGNASLEAPQINLQGLQPYTKLTNDLMITLDAQAANGQKITWLRLGLANGALFEEKQSQQFNYVLKVDQLPLHAHNTLYSEAVDNNNNRTRLYLPLNEFSLDNSELPPPATNRETLLTVNAQVRASQSTQSKQDSQYSPYVLLSVAKIDQNIEGILIRRWDSQDHMDEFYSRQLSFKNFIFIDRSAILKDNSKYKYSVAYTGVKSSDFGPAVEVELLPKYQLFLREPTDDTVISSGSNILFRWQYEIDYQLLPSAVKRYESFLVYSSEFLQKVIERSTFAQPLRSEENSLSIALSALQPSKNYIWTVNSLLRLSHSSANDGQYWKVTSESSPSLLQNISTSGFFNLRHEVTR